MPTERGVSSGYHASGTTQVATFPSGIAVGDLLTLLVMDGYAPFIPSGWTKAFITPGTNAFMAWKIATSGDVSTGSVTYTISNSYRGSWVVVATTVGTFATPATVASASASSSLSANWAPAMAFDGVVGGINNSWASANASLPQWLQATLSTAFAANRYSVACRTDDFGQAPNTWTFLGSNDPTFATFTTLDTRSGVVFATGEVKEYAIANTVAYLYYRINVTAVNGGTLTAISEFDVTKWWAFKDTSSALPQTATALKVVAGQKAYYFATARADGSAAGGTLNGSLGTAKFQRTSDPYWMSSLYAEDVSSTGTPAPVWSSTTGITQLVATSFAVNPSIPPPALGAASTASDVALAASLTATLGLSASTASDVALAADLTATIGLSAATADDVVLAADLTVIPTSTVVLDAATADDVTLAADLTLASHLDLGAAATGDDVALSADLTVTAFGDPIGTASTGSDVALAATLNTDLIHLLPWAEGDTGKTLLEIVLLDAELDITPPFAAVDSDGLPPVGTFALPPEVTIIGYPPITVERSLTRVSVTVPVMAPGPDGRSHVNDAVYAAYPTVTTDVGTVHTIIDNVDVTYFRGVPLGGTERLESPFGDVEASVSFPAITPQEQTGVGVLSWLKPDASFDRIMVHPDGSIRRLWSGFLVSEESGNDANGARTSWIAQGTLWQASTFMHRVPVLMPPADYGTIISRSMNRVLGRVYPVLPIVKTGLYTTDRGVASESELAYVERLLGKMWRSDGVQWSVIKTPGSRREYRLGIKSRTTVHHTITVGQRGVEFNLSRDATSGVNCIFGTGTLPNGLFWSGRCWPNYHPDTTPIYPLPPTVFITVGTTDADTDSGTGVSDWQQRINDLNLTPNVVIDGVFSNADADVLEDIQIKAGLLVDRVLGPQSWIGTFSPGNNSGDLNGSYRRPLAIHTSAEPYTYSASGAVTGANPGYMGVKRREEEIPYGPGTTLAEAKASAKLKLARDMVPGYTGTVVLRADTREDSRFFIIPGQNLKAVGYNGGDLLLHIVAVDRDYDNLTVTLTVDSKARDAMTVADINSRDRAARLDPSLRPGSVPRRSRAEPDIASPWDDGSDAGIIKKMALPGGLWVATQIPMSVIGSIAKVDLQTVPATKFVWGILANPAVTPAHMVSNVGDPLTGTAPFARTEAKGNALDDLGLIEAWGEAGGACGYGLGKEGSGTLNGRFVHRSPVTYNAPEGGVVTVVFWAAAACHISGRITPSAIQ